MHVEFDETGLLKAMDALGAHKAIFAASCADRHMLIYDSFCALASQGDSGAVHGAMEQLWHDLESGLSASAHLADHLDRVMAALPPEGEGEWVEQQPYAEDAVAAVAYAIRTLVTGESQEAVWAARRCYECADQFAINDLARNGVDSPSEDAILDRKSTRLNSSHL